MSFGFVSLCLLLGFDCYCLSIYIVRSSSLIPHISVVSILNKTMMWGYISWIMLVDSSSFS